MPPLTPPAPLDKSHDTSLFDCGVAALNDFLRRHAFASHQGGASRAYVATRGTRVVGFYTVAPASVRPEEPPERVMKGQPKHPVPSILLARLAVDVEERGTGMGKALLKDALLRAARAAGEIGGRVVLVHAKDEAAKGFYEKFGFFPSPIDEFHLFLLMKDIKANFG
jgi:GNAT superfamily N-acetyltransferase